MKKIFFVAALAALAAVGCTKSENSPAPEPEMLAAPVLTVENNLTSATFSWSAVENAAAYEYTFNGVPGTTTNTAIGFDALELNAEYVFTLRALAADDSVAFLNSEAVSETIFTGLEYEGEIYRIALMKDGNIWLAENLRYIPDGKTVSGDPAEDAGVWYPVANASPAAGDPSLVGVKGLLYDAATAFGVSDITESEAASFGGCRGICPEGWHIPTEREQTGLVGHNSDNSLNIPDAPYYDSSVGGARIDMLNADGFNWTFAGIRNKTNSTATGTYLATTATDENGGTVYGAMSYVLSSTFYKANSATNLQFYGLMSTYNASNKKVTVAYANYKSGYSVRCVKNR